MPASFATITVNLYSHFSPIFQQVSSLQRALGMERAEMFHAERIERKGEPAFKTVCNCGSASCRHACRHKCRCSRQGTFHAVAFKERNEIGSLDDYDSPPGPEEGAIGGPAMGAVSRILQSWTDISASTKEIAGQYGIEEW